MINYCICKKHSFIFAATQTSGHVILSIEDEPDKKKKDKQVKKKVKEASPKLATLEVQFVKRILIQISLLIWGIGFRELAESIV